MLGTHIHAVHRILPLTPVSFGNTPSASPEDIPKKDKPKTKKPKVKKQKLSVLN